MANYKFQNLAKTIVWQHFMDSVVCSHHENAINKQTHALFLTSIHCIAHTVIEIFKYMTKFMTCILVIKDICEIISDSLVII